MAVATREEGDGLYYALLLLVLLSCCLRETEDPSVLFFSLAVCCHEAVSGLFFGNDGPNLFYWKYKGRLAPLCVHFIATTDGDFMVYRTTAVVFGCTIILPSVYGAFSSDDLEVFTARGGGA